jgi:AcrR family transcriptional regulator
MTADADAVRRRPKDRKQQILAHARELFAEFGYPGVSMAMIAGRAGITAGALYRHYSTKADLLEAVVRDAFSGIPPPAGDLTLDEAIDRDITAIADRPHLADLWSREVRYLAGDVQREIRAAMRQANLGYVSLLRARRPALNTGQAELIAWSIQSLLSCLGRNSVRLPAGGGQALVRGAARALPDVPVEAARAEPRRRAGLAPASTRERLLIAATRHFAAQGYQEASMASIGAEAGVTGQSLYSYFDSKAELLRAVIVRGTHALWLELDSALAEAEDPAAALESVVTGYIRLARDWAGLRLDLADDPELAEGSRTAQREYVSEWVALLRKVRPELAAGEARALVQMTLTTISDSWRTTHLARRPAFGAELTAIAQAILASAPDPARKAGMRATPLDIK